MLMFGGGKNGRSGGPVQLGSPNQSRCCPTCPEASRLTRLANMLRNNQVTYVRLPKNRSVALDGRILPIRTGHGEAESDHTSRPSTLPAAFTGLMAERRDGKPLAIDPVFHV